MKNNLTTQELKTKLLEQIISKHCRCCDFSKHYYDDDILSALSQMEEAVKREFVENLRALPFHPEAEDYDGGIETRQVTWTTDIVNLENDILESLKKETPEGKWVGILPEATKSKEIKKGETKRIAYQKGFEEGKQEARESLDIGALRQWINEKPLDHIAIDQDIKIMLGLESLKKD